MRKVTDRIKVSISLYFRKIWAFDKAKDRVELMKGILSKAGVAIAKSSCQDFLRIDPMSSDFSKVYTLIPSHTYITSFIYYTYKLCILCMCRAHCIWRKEISISFFHYITSVPKC